MKNIDYTKVKELYDAGNSMKDITRATGVSKHFLSKWANENGYIFPKGRRLTTGAADFKNVKVLYDAGKSAYAISKITGINRFRIYKWADANGYKFKRCVGRQAGINSDHALELYKIGKCDREIAEALGVTWSMVINWRHRNRLPPWNPGHTGHRDTLETFSPADEDKPWKDPESLFCDTEFLNKIVGKEVRKV